METEDRWPMLPGPKWSSALDAKIWLIEQRRLLGWTHKDVGKAFRATAGKSDLFIGPGGGELFNWPTEKRVARFEREGETIPDWLYWMPLAIEHSQIPVVPYGSGGPWPAVRTTWERSNIPENTEVRREKEEADDWDHTYCLDDKEIALIELFRSLDANEQSALLFMSRQQIIKWWLDAAMQAEKKGTNIVEIVNAALARQ